MRRGETDDGILIVTVALWSLNFTASKYVLTHGFEPLAFSSLRYTLGSIGIAAFAFFREGSLRVRRRDVLVFVVPTALLVVTNQFCFVYALKYSTASTVALVLGTTPVFVGIFAWLFRLERVESGFWIAAAVSFGGVALVAVGSGSVAGTLKGDLIALACAAAWAAYSVLIVPLMRRYSPYRGSAVVMLMM